MWGFWPTSTVPADLQLKATEPKGHWIEISETRQKLMNTYNRYIEVPRSPDSVSSPDFGEDELERMAWNALFRGVWEGAYLLSQYVFSPSPQTQMPIHPLGMGMNWTATDTDLASAVVVSLSASSKTARSFAYHLSRRPAARLPLGLVQVTSLPSPISKAAESLRSNFPMKTVDYTDVPESLEWMAGLKASKIVIADFGARANSLGQLLELIKNHAALHSPKVVIIQVGSQQKVRPPDPRPRISQHLLIICTRQVYTDEEQLAAKEAMSKLGKVQYNTSGVQDAVMQADGAEAYFDKLARVWDEFYRTRHASIPDMRIIWGEGISGPGGIEGGWEKLCKGRVGGSEGLVYRL